MLTLVLGVLKTYNIDMRRDGILLYIFYVKTVVEV